MSIDEQAMNTKLIIESMKENQELIIKTLGLDALIVKERKEDDKV